MEVRARESAESALDFESLFGLFILVFNGWQVGLKTTQQQL
jgi:hypothetical protein